MEKNTRPELIPIAELSRDYPYGFRFDYRDPALEISLEKQGLLFPLLVARAGERSVVISGNKRLSYALRKKWEYLPAVMIKKEFTAEDAPAPMRWDSKAAAKLEVSLPLAPGLPLFGGYPDPLKETLGMGLPGVSESAGFLQSPEPEAKGDQSLREAQGQGAAAERLAPAYRQAGAGRQAGSRPLTARELFLLSLLSNWNQNFSDLDRMTALRRAEEDFGFEAEEIQNKILPLVGLPAGRKIWEEYRKAAGLVPELHALIQNRKLPFKGSSVLSRLPLEEQKLLAREVLNKVRLTTNQVSMLAAWFVDLKKIQRINLGTLLQEEGLQTVLAHSKMDERARAERLFEAVRTLRFPRLSEEEKKFQRLKSRLSEPEAEEICLEKPEGFETEGVLLRARLKNKEGLTRVVKFLEKNRSSLETFL